MTRKVYKSAMGKEVDLGALLLQNEQVRAVGNMNVNARGDVLDSANRVIDQKNRQVQRQYQRTVTNVSAAAPVHSSTRTAKQTNSEIQNNKLTERDIFSDLEEPAKLVEAPASVSEDLTVTSGGLAAAIARSRLIKQEKELTLREREKQQQTPIKKI